MSSRLHILLSARESPAFMIAGMLRRNGRRTRPPGRRSAGVVSLPVRWEHVPETERAGAPDPLLWFEARCSGRDLLTGNGNTFPGRMAAWCPDQQVSYNVSLAEMGQMSQQATYYVSGSPPGTSPARPRRRPRHRHRPVPG
jgi:hypothetical protein